MLTKQSLTILLSIILSTLLQASLCQNTLDNTLTYGSIIKLRQPSSNRWVHSHEVRFGRGDIFSVTGYYHDDLGNYWQILEQFPYTTKTYTQPIRCGDVIRLKSVIIGYNLRVDQTSFGLTTQLIPMVHGMPDNRADAAVNWKVKCPNKQKGQALNFGDEVKLKHSVTGKYLQLDASSQYTQFNCRGCEIIGQVQIHAVQNDSDDEKTTFKILDGLTFDQHIKGKDKVKEE